ncbi:RbsD/FucU domain-containing protein [Bradyrhizobium iriomotense]|uniref:D-ribose pyranase n=1 Tax=Bradyrhizobium iriomotense TaxID=441950 RepID=A0ABQ6AXV8_9BRAD|nr:RbsD/FucU domain-containing protein [Bradyrhizobium iriomotense]GLR86381.1 hypothetical protein GCM10007857_30920 [Bradyrhizobium iriomotense]
MLKSINALLKADVLYALLAIGHGDRLVVCDTNFPADSIARYGCFIFTKGVIAPDGE